MEDRASWHTVHGRENIAAAQEILETLDAESHFTGFRDVDLVLVVLVAFRVTDASHVFQKA